MACWSERQNVWWMLNYSWRGRARWEEDSPQHLMILHEMFQHALEQGQKEAEHMICQGCWHGLPKLDLEADISGCPAGRGPRPVGEEFKSLYYEVYKLWRLLESAPGEPELVAEVVPSLEDCQGQERGEMPQTMGSPIQLTSGPQGAGPLGGRGGIPLWKGVLLRQERPTGRPWPQWLP